MEVLNESLKFLIKNLKDILFAPYERDEIAYSFMKMVYANDEFNKYHKMTKGLADRILKAINQYDTRSKTDSVIDVVELDRYWHRRLKAEIIGGKDSYLANSPAIIGAMLYRHMNYNEFKDYDTYTALIGLPPDNRFVIALSFDENNIYKVQTFTSPNFYDVKSPVYLVTLPVDL